MANNTSGNEKNKTASQVASDAMRAEFNRQVAEAYGQGGTTGSGLQNANNAVNQLTPKQNKGF